MALDNFKRYRAKSLDGAWDGGFIVGAIGAILLVSLFVFLINYSSDLYNSNTYQTLNSFSDSVETLNQTSFVLPSTIPDLSEQKFKMTSASVLALNNSYLSFDGVDDYVALPQGSILNNETQNFTITLWFENNNKSGANILNFGYSTSTSTGFQLRRGTSDPRQFFPCLGNTTYVSCVGGHVFPSFDNEIYMAAITYNEGNVSTFINGAYINSSVYVPNIRFLSNSRTISTSASFFYRGFMDEVRIYNRTLELTEIEAINNSGRIANSSLPSDGLVLWMPFEEANGTVVYDWSGNNNNGELYG
jgi:hypothetical protein